MPRMSSAKTISSYIVASKKEAQPILKKVYQTIKKAAPKAEESISYGMPTFKMNGKPLVYFAAWEKHIGFYALPATNIAFKKELVGYTVSKGSIQFPYDKPMPLALITKMVKFRIKESSKKKK
jgi:uncharacterized protein YdhG (YjbR/CyaY superfamily)